MARARPNRRPGWHHSTGDKVMRLGIVVPCYNEEAVLPETARRLLSILSDLTREGIVSNESAVYFVDDGSHDATWPMIRRMAEEDPRIHGLKLSRNRGHQNALLAGLLAAEGDALISVDADLQDDLAAIPKMLEAARKGNDVVYGVRSSRTTDTFFKRQTAQWYYRLLHMFGVDAVYDHADYRLLSRRAIDALRRFGEVNLFLRGIVPQLASRPQRSSTSDTSDSRGNPSIRCARCWVSRQTGSRRSAQYRSDSLLSSGCSSS